MEKRKTFSELPVTKRIDVVTRILATAAMVLRYLLRR